VRWYSSVTREQWRTLAAAQLGWMLDAMDVMLYAFALTAIAAEFGLSGSVSGALASATLVTSGLGGGLFGFLADRYGRARSLVWSILAYSVFTALTATSANLPQLVLWRALVGFGLGGEWAAGSVLVAESWPPEHRGKAIGFMQAGWAIGYILAAMLAAAVLPRYGWRALFALGILPALAAAWIFRAVPEPRVWTARRERRAWPMPLSRNFFVATMLTTTILFAYWGLFTWIPAYLASPPERGGAGMSTVRSSAWIVPMQIGAFFGYILFGFLADRFGRRPTFICFVLAAAALVPVYGQWGRSPSVLMALGPLVGFFGHGYFSVFGALLAESFPVSIRATAQGLCYNVGRAAGGAAAPFVIGAAADRYGIGSALALTSVFFVAGALVMLAIKETRGAELE
jgi:MFS family permease